MAVVWVLNVLGWGAWAGVLYFFDSGLPNNSEAPSGEDGQWHNEQTWINISVHIEIGLFTYFNLATVPWRWANMVHLWFPRRPNDVGLDFYGRPSDAIWFYIAHKERRRIVAFMLLSVAFHLVLQGARIYWSDYQGAHTYPGQVVMNICLVGTVGLGLTAGVYQGINEEKLRKQRPDAFAPAFTFYVARGFRRWRAGGNGSLWDNMRTEYRTFERVQNRLSFSGVGMAELPLQRKMRGERFPDVCEISSMADDHRKDGLPV